MDQRRARITARTGPLSRRGVPTSPRSGAATGFAIRSTGSYFAELEAEGLSPSPEADRPTLIKRLSIDLVGLPPAPQEVDAFVADADPEAYEKLVDRLLASPHYGERMALGWLDAARYADSNGFQQDGDTWQWIWRDWVVRAINQDLPFDQFTTWQLAGDLLPEATIDQKIASGFNRNHLLNGEGGAIAEEQRFVNLFDRVDTTATTWLGLTMACAQCHDHKYDPITQRDYYGLLDAFNRVPGNMARRSVSHHEFASRAVHRTPHRRKQGADRRAQSRRSRRRNMIRNSPATLPLRAGERASPTMATSASGKGLSDALAAILRKPEAGRTGDEQKSLDSGLRKHFDDKVWPGLAEKLPAIARIERAQESTGRLPGRQAAARHGDERRKAPPDVDPQPRRVPPARRESLVFNPELLAAASQGHARPIDSALPAGCSCPSTR